MRTPYVLRRKRVLSYPINSRLAQQCFDDGVAVLSLIASEGFNASHATAMSAKLRKAILPVDHRLLPFGSSLQELKTLLLGQPAV